MTIRIDGTNTAANPGITGTDTDTGLQFGTDEVNIVTGGTTAVTVDSSQRVGIGAASPFGPLHVRMGTNQNIYFTNGIGEIGNVPGFQGINDAGSALTSIGMRGTDIRFACGSSERLRITSDGTLQLRNSPGIDFSQIQGAPDAGTSTSEVLDAYEEGTWTPTASTNMGTVTNANGNYIRVGNVVTVNYYFSTTSVSTVDNSQIEGLPFNVEQNISGSSVVGTGVAFEDNRIYMHFAAGGTDNITIETDRPIQGSTSGGLQNIRGSLTYMTA